MDGLINGCEKLARGLPDNITSGDTVQSANITCNGSLINGTKIEKQLGVPLLESDYRLAVVYCCVISLALFLGVIGNAIILLVSATTAVMNKIGKHFVINLALADLCVAGVADPMCILGVLKGARWFKSKWILCEVVASLCLTACFCAFLSLTMMTINRYVFVCHHQTYFKIYKRSVCLILCASCWVFAFFFEFPNLVGWGDHYFDEKNHQCIWDRTASLSYTLILTIGLIGGPLFLCLICFILIFWKIFRSKKEVFALNTDVPMRLKKVWIESFRSSRTLVVIFFAFLVCWTPYAVITAIDVNDAFSTEVHLFVTLLAHFHSSLNFIIYMASNKGFRQSVLVTFKRMSSRYNHRDSIDNHLRSASSDTTKSDIPTGKNKFLGLSGEKWEPVLRPDGCFTNKPSGLKEIQERSKVLESLADA